MSQSRVLALLGTAILASMQQVPTRTLSTPEIEIPREFTGIDAVRELRDGRVVVLDLREELLAIVDFRDATVRQLGRVGSGPGEYKWPSTLLTLSGGALALGDGGNGRTLRINADGTLGRVLDRLPDGLSDTSGWFYRRGQPVRVYPNGRTELLDSVAIERLDLATGAVNSVAFMQHAAGFKVTLEPGARAAHVHPRDPPLAFGSSDQWAVAPDGRIAVVSLEPYRVTLFRSGERVDGPVIRYERIPVSARDREEWLAAWRRPQEVLVQKGRGRDAPRAKIMAPGPFSDRPVQFPTHFPALPPREALSFAPDGRLWVHRATSLGAPAMYDVYDERARLVGRVLLPTRSRVVAFGTRSIYVVRANEDDFEYLQRYPF